MERSCDNCKHVYKEPEDFPCNCCVRNAIDNWEASEVCSDCGHTYNVIDSSEVENFRFCPYCGKKIRSEEE